MRRDDRRFRTNRNRRRNYVKFKAQKKKVFLLFLVVDENVVEVLGTTECDGVLHLFDESLVNLYEILQGRVGTRQNLHGLIRHLNKSNVLRLF